MSLVFKCNTCNTQYEAQVNSGSIAYLDNNKRLILKDENADCHNCQKEIGQAIETKRAEIKAKQQTV
jgi:hypothetical protein